MKKLALLAAVAVFAVAVVGCGPTPTTGGKTGATTASTEVKTTTTPTKP
jgi:hypothetical protein